MPEIKYSIMPVFLPDDFMSGKRFTIKCPLHFNVVNSISPVLNIDVEPAMVDLVDGENPKVIDSGKVSLCFFCVEGVAWGERTFFVVREFQEWGVVRNEVHAFIGHFVYLDKTYYLFEIIKVEQSNIIIPKTVVKEGRA